MKTIILLLISLSFYTSANADQLVLLSDSSKSKGHIQFHAIKSQLARTLSCQHKHADFIDNKPDITQVLLTANGLHIPNLTMRGHYPSITSETVSVELCEKVAKIIATAKNQPIPYSFKLFVGTRDNGNQYLEEQLTVYFPLGLTLKSVKRNFLFQ